MMLELSVTTNVVLAAGLGLALWKIRNFNEDYRQTGLFGRWPIRRVNLDQLDPCFAVGALGPSRNTEIRFFANYRVTGGTSDLETWVLCTLAKNIGAKNIGTRDTGAGRIFEIGTCTGKTTYLLAANAPAEARVVSITLKPEHMSAYKAMEGDDQKAFRDANAESTFVEFYYTGTPESARIEQLFGDSKDFDETPYLESCDLVFVDGSHARSYVESDSAKAIRMVKPGGLVLWHDYRGPRHTPGVYQALNQLARTLPLVHIKMTNLVAYRKPGGNGNKP